MARSTKKRRPAKSGSRLVAAASIGRRRRGNVQRTNCEHPYPARITEVVYHNHKPGCKCDHRLRGINMLGGYYTICYEVYRCQICREKFGDSFRRSVKEFIDDYYQMQKAEIGKEKEGER
jgi:hypothetical protein